MAEKTFRGLMDQARQSDAYWSARAVYEFTEDVVRLMEQRGLTKSELAARLGCSPAYVTKILRGNANFTVDSMVRLARAVDGCLTLHVGRETAGNAGAKSRTSLLSADVGGNNCLCLHNHMPPAAPCSMPLPGNLCW